MLQVKHVFKHYKTGDFIQVALNDVSLNLRDNEFVSILGPSGSGKTTLLNVIGGLDHYDDGDLIINGTSTKKYKDKDWDSYRNHTIGFVFQSYNLIPHQTILANVEMALTISGVSKGKRKKMAIAALEEVGLKDHMHKKPNQLSGGQMQRVAIARALVNNPDILLADEPTGALDTETSIQIMNLLKKVAEDRLVVMVTHNPELAEAYSTRIVRLMDGHIIGDTDPFEVAEQEIKSTGNMGKAGMNFFTSLALSANNLMTKKARTILTAFAGSIGIIGIALILSLSSGVNNYIDDIQKETMTSYPITIDASTYDMSSMFSTRLDASDFEDKSGRTEVYADYTQMESEAILTSGLVENDLTAFKRYIEDPDSEINQYIGENGVVYTYDVKFDVFSYDSDGSFVNSDSDPDDLTEGTSLTSTSYAWMSLFSGGSETTAANFSQIMAGSKGDCVSPVVEENYDLIYGEWPDAYDEVVLVLDSDNSITAETLYQLGLMTGAEYVEATETYNDGGSVDPMTYSYEEICQHEFYLVTYCDRYQKNDYGTYTYVEDLDENYLRNHSTTLKIVGIIKAAEDANNANITTTVAYTNLLTDYIIEHTDASQVVIDQEANQDTNLMTGLPFEEDDDQVKIETAAQYLMAMNLYDESMEEDYLITIYDKYIAGDSYEDVMTSLGKVSYDAPSSISIYTDSFEDKEAISDCIEDYNKTVSEDEQITYVDYVSLLTGSITSIINVISYVLIAFVAVSLVVSCIMIGIITHISVLERTKEIGILRALGASKGNISQVFIAETVIIGLISGLIGVGVTALLNIPINAIIAALSGMDSVKSVLPVGAAVILVLISMGITVLGGIIPAKKAAKKDPVTALRTE